jgi:hypothetical protein
MNTEAGLECWETEWGVLVVFGTHDPNVAYAKAKEWYSQNSEVPEDLEEGLRDYAARWWADPAVKDTDGEAWPDTLVSREEVPGWIPYLVVNW